jgi:hypothetical protein
MANQSTKKDNAVKAIGTFNKTLRRVPVEVVWYTHFDTELAAQLRPELGQVGFRELFAIQTVAAPGQVSLEESRFLGQLVSRTDPAEPIVEIGTLFGSSSRVLAMFKAENQPLITVDNFSWNPLDVTPEVHEYAARRALAEGVEKYNVTVVKKEKQEFFDSFEGPAPGLVFLDADHSYEATLADMLWAQSVGAKIISGHDYGDDPGVTKAVDELGGPSELVGTVFVL